MTQTEKSSRKVISGAGWVNPLTHDYRIDQAAHAHVFADTVELVQGVDYTVSNIGLDAGYVITITNAGAWAPTTWVLDARPAIDQGSNLSIGGQFGAAYEDTIDKLTRRVQRTYDQARRGLKTRLQDAVVDNPYTLPEPTATQFVRWNAAGTDLENANVALLGGVVVSDDVVMTDDSHIDVPSEHAVKTYVLAGDAAVTAAFTAADAAVTAAFTAADAAVTAAFTAADTLKMAKSANLSDVASVPTARSNIVVGTYVADRTALKALDTTKDVVAVLREGNRKGTFIWTAGDFSTQIAADTQEGIYVKATAIASNVGAWVRQFVGLADVRWFGAALDDTTDDRNAFNVALTVADGVYFPPGRAYITDMVTVPNNKQLVGANVSSSIFSVKATFNMAALGVVQMGSSENTGLIDKIGFEFAQTDQAVRANCTQYPYAINHAGIPRVRIGHIRISRGWNGINATGNAGGATYDWIECGCLNIGLNIDGALDTMNIGRFRAWPFGISNLTNLYNGVYSDGVTIGFQLGRCDGLAGEVHMFKAKFEVTASVGSAHRHLTAVHLDGDGARLRVLEGPLDIDFLYSTKSPSETGQTILLDGAGAPLVKIDNIYSSDGTSAQPPILVNVGSLDINGGRIYHNALANEACIVQGGHLGLRNIEMTAPGARTQRYILASTSVGASDLVVQNCNFPPNGGTGQAIVTVATVTGVISNNAYNGRTVANGSVVNECDSYQAYTPTLTSGIGTLTTTTGLSGQFQKSGQVVNFEAKGTITTNGTGAASLIFTLPVANVGLDTVVAAYDTTAGLLLSGLINANGTTVKLKLPAGTYPGADGKTFIVSGSYKAFA